MAKKKVVEVTETLSGEDFAEITSTEELVPAQGGIALLTNDLGREDLNELRDKINEIITRG